MQMDLCYLFNEEQCKTMLNRREEKKGSEPALIIVMSLKKLCYKQCHHSFCGSEKEKQKEYEKCKCSDSGDYISSALLALHLWPSLLLFILQLSEV